MTTLLEPLARSVARELAGITRTAWTVTERHEDRWQLATVGVAITFGREWGYKARYTVRADAPNRNAAGDAISVLAHNERAAEITVSDAKAPGTIARDIARRLLPDARAQHIRATERIAADNAYNARASELAARIAKFGKRATHTVRGEHRVYVADGPTVQVYADSVTFDRFTATPEQAEAILAALAATARKTA